MADDYKTDCIKRCAEMNGPCWECVAREECLMWEESE
jgi:hypothetical protein